MPLRNLIARRSAQYTGRLRGPWLGAGWCMVAMLLVLCLIPLKSLPLDAYENIDKVYHMIAFSELMWWFAMVTPARRWWRLVAWLAVLAVGIEILQSFEPFRTASLADVAADMVGVAVGAVLALLTPAGFPPVWPAKCPHLPPEAAPTACPPDTVRATTRRRP